MTNDIIPIGQQINNVSAAMRQRMAGRVATANRAYSSNVTSSYPLLSIRGKEFTFRLPDGRSARHEQNGFAMPFIDLILVEGSPLLSKTFYEKGFDPSEFTRPDCWSLDSVKPDPSSPALQRGVTGPICATCKMNEFGSKITDNKKKAKACQDYRRVVVLSPHQIGSETATPMALRVPQSSLKNLKAHAELLERYGVDVNACVSRLSFTQEAFPQLKFDYVSILDEQQYDWILELAKSPLVQGMVFTPDFENATTTPEQQTPMHNEGLKPLTPAPAPSALDALMGNAAPAQQPVEEEEDEPAPQPQPTNLVELPDGRWYNPATKQYVEAPAPAAPVQEDDPDTMALPDGKFFNSRLKTYVTGLELGAPAVGAEPAKPEPKKRAPRKPKVEPVGGALAAAAAAAEEPQDEAPEQPKPNGNGHVVSSTEALDALMKAALEDNSKA